MRVLFIYPNINAQIGFNYGVSYISGYLKARGIETGLLNVNDQLGYGLDLDRIRRDIAAFRPDVIGISVVTNQYRHALEIAFAARSASSAPILFGGIHPTMDPVSTLQEAPIDAICIGEGEEAFHEYLEKGTARGVRNMAFRDGEKIVQAPLRPYTDIHRLPPKDYEIFDFQKMIDAKDGWVGLLASRGCPFRCTYCLNHRIISLYKDSGHLPRLYLRRHTVDEVLSEVEFLLSRYRGIRMFIFDDDIFTFDKGWLREFSEKYPSVSPVGFTCNAHVKMFDEEVAEYLKRAGCRIVKFGLESGSERIRKKVLNRYMTNGEIERAFAAAHKFGLHTSAFVMIGLPWEEKRDIVDTLELLARIRPGRFRWSLFFPYVGTRAYRIAEEACAIDFEKMKVLDNFTDATCMDLGEETNLFVDKVKEHFCTFVNGLGGAEVRDPCASILGRVDAMNAEQWRREKKEVAEHVARAERQMGERGTTHYAVRYNRFMGVRSDWEDDSLPA